jgi:uncharacterized membrane protein (DUF485 family)
MNIEVDSVDGEENLSLGIILTLIQVLVFFGFIYLCAFHATSLAADPFDMGIPWSFIVGLLVIVCGAALTTIYVLVTNRAETE